MATIDYLSACHPFYLCLNNSASYLFIFYVVFVFFFYFVFYVVFVFLYFCIFVFFVFLVARDDQSAVEANKISTS